MPKSENLESEVMVDENTTPLQAVERYRQQEYFSKTKGKQAKILAFLKYPLGASLTIVLVLVTSSFWPLVFYASVPLGNLVAKISKTEKSYFWMWYEHTALAMTIIAILFLFPEAYLIIMLNTTIHLFLGSYFFGIRSGAIQALPIYLSVIAQFFLLGQTDGGVPISGLELISFLLANTLIAVYIFNNDLFLGSSLLKAAVSQKVAQNSSEKINTILQSAGEGVIVTNNQGIVTYVNDHTHTVLGSRSSDIMGRNIHQNTIFYSEAGAAVTEDVDPMNLALKAGSSITGSISSTIKFYVKRHDNDEISPVGFTTSPIYHGSKIEGTVTFIHDITKDLKLDQAKTEFVSLASHQLRTPLSTIKWYIERITKREKDSMGEKTREDLDTIKVSTQNILALVNDLLNASRAELGTLKITGDKVDPHRILKDVYVGIKDTAVKKNLELIVEDDEDDKIVLNGSDKVLLNVMFENLISNAIKYTERGKIKVTLKVLKPTKDVVPINGQRLISLKGGIAFSVEDSGIGIPKEQQPKIFEKLFRADNVTSIGAEGTGLGMYLTRKFVEAMSGTIWFTSEEGKGSTFTIYLPSYGVLGAKYHNFPINNVDDSKPRVKTVPASGMDLRKSSNR